jgi:hypothetical protein
MHVKFWYVAKMRMQEGCQPLAQIDMIKDGIVRGRPRIHRGEPQWCQFESFLLTMPFSERDQEVKREDEVPAPRYFVLTLKPGISSESNVLGGTEASCWCSRCCSSMFDRRQHGVDPSRRCRRFVATTGAGAHCSRGQRTL